MMQDSKWGNQSAVSEFILMGFTTTSRTAPLLFFFFLVIYLLILLGNGLLITLVQLDQRLHTPMYFFLSFLSSLDISYTTTTVPQMLAHLLSRKRSISFSSCVAQMYIFLLFGVTESWLFSIMSVDRYFAICHPLRYKVIMSRWTCLFLAGICGMYGVVGSLIYTYFAMRLPYCGPNRINHFFCEVPAVLKLACADTTLNDWVDFIVGFNVIVVPQSLILVIYVNIFVAILRIRSAQGRLKAFSTCASHITVVTMFGLPCILMYMRPSSQSNPSFKKSRPVVFCYIFPGGGEHLGTLAFGSYGSWHWALPLTFCLGTVHCPLPTDSNTAGKEGAAHLLSTLLLHNIVFINHAASFQMP